jgi:hypothetical protein
MFVLYQGRPITVFLPMSKHFLIEIPCKPYVKAYLENCCGTPVNLQHLPNLMEELRRGLSKVPCHKDSKKITEKADKVKIIIPPNYFYRYGWELEEVFVRDFNKIIEHRVKYIMRQYISLNSSMGIPVADCIRSFQDKFGFQETIWSFDSIKKDFTRNGIKSEMNFMKEIRHEINKIFLSNLSELGTISKKFQKEQVYG